MTTGTFPLTGVKDLPNVTIAHPGEVWTNAKASGAITPGEAVVPVSSGGKLYCRKAISTDVATQLAVAANVVREPDVNTGPSAKGPNELANENIAQGNWVRRFFSGALHLTLVTPDTYLPGDLIGWDENGARPTGKTGSGAWAKNAAADIDSVFEVVEWRKYNAQNEGILTVRFVGRSQF